MAGAFAGAGAAAGAAAGAGAGFEPAAGSASDGFSAIIRMASATGMRVRCTFTNQPL